MKRQTNSQKEWVTKMKAIIDMLKNGLYRYEEVDKGHIARVASPQDLLSAAEKARDAGIKKFDCFSPYPIHGLEKAMGLSRSWVNFVTLMMGLFGASFAMDGMWYIMAFDWPQIFGGKPFFAWPAFIPITFELTILFAGHSTVAAVIMLGKLGKVSRKPILDTTSEGLAIWIGDDKSRGEVESILGGLATEIVEVEQEEQAQ